MKKFLTILTIIAFVGFFNIVHAGPLGSGMISGGAGAASGLGDIVTTTPLTVNGGANLDDVLPGGDADVTFNMPAATNATAGHATAAHIQAIEANTAKVTAHGNGADCAAGSYPLGVDANGAVVSCTDASTEIDSIVATHNAIAATNAIPGHATAAQITAIEANTANWDDSPMTGDPTVTDSTPTQTLQDSDDAPGTAGSFANSSGGVNDMVWCFGVEDSSGESTEYFCFDGVNERIEMKMPLYGVGGLTGNWVVTGNVSGATYGSDSSISDAELLTLDDCAVTEMFVGGGAGSAPVCTTVSGTGAPVRGTSPTITTPVTTIKRYYPATLTDTSTPHDLTIAECSNTLITTQGWNGTDDITFNLPDISAYDGTEGVLIVRFRDTVGMQDADTDFYIDPDAATQIALNTAITGTNGDRIWNDNIGIYEGITCMSDYDGTLAGYWICDTVSGAWLDKGS